MNEDDDDDDEYRLWGNSYSNSQQMVVGVFEKKDE